MKTYVEVLQEAIPGITNDDLYMPLNGSCIHNLDLIVLRGSLENYFGIEIPDSDWKNLYNLFETLEYCRRKKNTLDNSLAAEPKLNMVRDHEISLPEMANKALSENWLLKEMGDMHWKLLAKGLEQKPSEFTDALGNRLYAAFVRVKYVTSRLNEFCEGGSLHLESQISRYGNCSYFTTTDGHCGSKTLHAQMMTSFSARKADDNSQIAAGNPDSKVNHVPELPGSPEFYIEHRLLKKGLIKEIRSGGYTFSITDEELDSMVHTINPHYEINGVGLVYFAAYPMIADICASGFFRDTMEMTDYDAQYHTIFRDVFYYANCNANDKIVVKLNSAMLIDNDRIQLTASLYRQSDNKLMARVLTVKEKA